MSNGIGARARARGPPFPSGGRRSFHVDARVSGNCNSFVPEDAPPGSWGAIAIDKFRARLLEFEVDKCGSMGTEADDMIGPDHEVTAMYGPATVTVADEVRRARRLGIILRISKDEDRLPTDTRQNPCPTCNDGTLSAMFPRQCRWCEPITRALRGL